MGNTQTNDKSKGKSPGKGKQFIRNFNRKSPGRDSKKHGRKKCDTKQDAIDRFDKTPDSDNNEAVEDSDTVESVSAFRTMGGSECASVQSEVTVSRCGGRSATRDEPQPDRSTSESVPSVFTEPLTPLAVELNQCYYSAESSAREDDPLDNTLKEMPHDDAISSLSTEDMEKDEKNDVFDNNSDRGDDDKVMGGIFSGLQAGEQLERTTHETNHEFRDHRLKAAPGQTSFTITKHRKVELPPVKCDTSMIMNKEEEKERVPRTASVGDVPTDSNVLRKVASLTLEKHADTRFVRPKFVPEKLDFQLYEKFEGQMLLNWFVASVSENIHLKHLLSSQDLKNIGILYCTHLLAAGVLRQIPDKDAPTENEFKPNLMYYWAHMDIPASQPVTPGRLHMPSAWPPDRESCQAFSSLTYDTQSINQNNNEEISNLNEAKKIIAQLRHKLKELEYELETQRLTMQIENLNKNLNEINQLNIMSRVQTCMVSKEVQTNDEVDNISCNKPVINRPDNDSIRTNVNNVAISDDKEDQKHYNIPHTRSDKVVNYCKLNKIRDNNKVAEEKLSETKSCDENLSVEKLNEIDSFTTTCESLSDVGSGYESTNSKDIQPKEETQLNSTKLSPSTHVMYSIVVKKHSNWPSNIDSTGSEQAGTLERANNATTSLTRDVLDSEKTATLTQTSESALPLPESCKITAQSPTESEKGPLVMAGMGPSAPLSEKGALSSEIPEVGQPPVSMPETVPPTTPLPGESSLPPAMPKMELPAQPISGIDPPMLSIVPPPTPMPDMGPPPPPMPDFGPSPPPMPDMGPPPPPMPDMAPPPLPMPSIGPPPPPMPDMGPPPPPMPGMRPSPLPMPGMGSPPPPMPDMGPPPPPMPDMGPPPPPMPGMGPPPPPMPGMGPPPPPMPGMGPPPPPMPDMGPPPPPMPDMGPPPPPMPGMGPPPPPMPGMGPPPPPMPGMGPPPPPMPGIGPAPPPMPGMGPPPPPMPGGGPPRPPMPPPALLGAPPPPPGPGMSPAPFPAPPVGGWTMQRAALRKTPVKPAAPMKPLYWTRILAAPSQSTGQEDSKQTKPLWLEIDEAKLDNIDEFTDLFSRQVVKAPVKKKVEVKTKVKPTKILDSKRSQNVGILAQSLHVEFSEIENAIYNFDTSVVSLEALQQIYELRATEEELAMIKEHLRSKPEQPLDRPEMFLHDLSSIPHFAERVSCFMFQAEFEDAVTSTMHKLDNLKHTCEFLMTSEPLKKLFAIILTLGNYMNGGNGHRGQADGFGIEILAKLKDVKSKQSNITLLHFIVRTYMRSCGGALADTCALPVPEPGDVARAAAIDFADVAAQLDALATQLAGCKEKTMKVIEDASVSPSSAGEAPATPTEGNKRLDVFKDKMTSFLKAAEEKLRTETENLEECRTKFVATVKFYQYTPKGGKPEDCEPNEFFSLWTSFCSDFKDIYKKEEQLAIKERLKEAKKMQDERKSLTQPKKEGGLKARMQKLSNKKS